MAGSPASSGGGESPLFTRDYYPLTPWSVDPARLLAFQFHDPSSGQGIVQVFSGPTATERSASLTLRGLDPLAGYAVTHWDDPDKTATFTFCFRSISA